MTCTEDVVLTVPGNKNVAVAASTEAGETNGVTVELKQGESVVVSLAGPSTEGQFTVTRDGP